MKSRPYNSETIKWVDPGFKNRSAPVCVIIFNVPGQTRADLTFDFQRRETRKSLTIPSSSRFLYLPSGPGKLAVKLQSHSVMCKSCNYNGLTGEVRLNYTPVGQAESMRRQVELPACLCNRGECEE